MYKKINVCGYNEYFYFNIDSYFFQLTNYRIYLNKELFFYEEIMVDLLQWINIKIFIMNWGNIYDIAKK